MKAAYLLVLVFYFTVAASTFCLTLIFIPMRAAGAYRTGRRGRIFYALRATLALLLWVGLSALICYVPLLLRLDGTDFLLDVLFLSGAAAAHFASGKSLLYFVSRREMISRRLQRHHALRAR